MTSSRDYYGILGLKEGASYEDIKKRFRQLALQYHPDRNPDDPISEKMFKLVAEAYHVLSDQERRLLYDHQGHEGLKKRGYRGFKRTEDVLRTFSSEFFDFLGIGGTGSPVKRPPMVPGKASRLTSWKAVPSVREMVSNHPPHCNPVLGAAEVARTLQLQKYLAQ
jgi:DnaJ-class molecular chaperone